MSERNETSERIGTRTVSNHWAWQARQAPSQLTVKDRLGDRRADSEAEVA
jgi:hypothetical protein